MSAITPVVIPAALKDTESHASFTFAREWTVHEPVRKLSSNQMDFWNVSVPVADYSTAGQDVIIGLPILLHLGIDLCTLLKRVWIRLTSMECSSGFYNKKADECGTIGRWIIARLNPQTEQQKMAVDPSRPRINYYATTQYADPSRIPRWSNVFHQMTIQPCLERLKNTSACEGPQSSQKHLKDLLTLFGDIRTSSVPIFRRACKDRRTTYWVVDRDTSCKE